MKKLIWFAIFALGVAMVVPASRTRIMTTLEPHLGAAGQIATRTTLGRLADDLEAAAGAAWPGGLPEQGDFNEWLIRQKGSTLQDQWGGDIWYQLTRSSFTVGSNGPDGTRGSEDDLTVTREVQNARRR
ncbi:MAG TPA: hypothetical protein VGA70_07035 [Longimicrobiales bacterium]|jgi:hypothetical protein